MHYDFETLVNRTGTGSSKWEGMKKHNPNIERDIVPLSVADMELKNAPEIIEGLQDYLGDAILGYTTETEGYLASVTSWMERRHNWKVDPQWIVTAPGVVPALGYAVQAFTKPGDGVIINRPVYYPFSMVVGMTGRKVVNNPLIHDEEKRSYTFDLEDLRQKAADPANTLMILCSPHNPVGRVWTREELTEVGRICQENNVILVVDEIHQDFVMPGHKHTVLASICPEFAQNTITCTAPSKTFNLAGMQTSNIIIPNAELREKFASARLANAVISLNILGYKACEIAYNKCENWLDQLLSLIHLNAKTVEAFVEKNLPQLKVYPLEGTYLLWVDCRGLGMYGKDLENFMKDEAKLFLDEGILFGEEGDGFERINLACPTKVLVEALERLKAAVDVLNARGGFQSKKRKAGDKMPDFIVDTPFRSGVPLRELTGGRPTAILFLRYYGCTLCQYDIHQLKVQYEKIASQGAKALVVLQSDPAGMAQQLQPGDLPFEIVCDPQQKLYGELDIRPAKDKMELAGGDALGKIAKVKEEGFQHGAYEGEELQLPACFVVDGNLTITYAHYGKNAADIPTVEELAQLVKG